MNTSPTKHVILFVAYILLLSLVSCVANIEAASANSISAILAVFGEYILAGFSIILLFLLHSMRIIGVVLSVISIYMLYNDIKIGQLDITLLLLIGLLLLLISFLLPVRYHEPKVMIAKNIAKLRSNELWNDSHRYVIFEILIGLVIGIILMIIEHNIDFTFIK